jgi:hypothetical protein
VLQKQRKPHKKEVIEIDSGDSSDGSRFSQTKLQAEFKHKNEPRMKKRDRNYDEVEEVVGRRKDPPEYLSVAPRADAKDTLHGSKWPSAGDDGLTNNLKRKSSQYFMNL